MSVTDPGRGLRGLLLCAALGVAGLVALGTWQLDRLAQKKALIADRQAMLERPLLDLSKFENDVSAVAYRRIKIGGRFLHDKELRIGPRPFRGVAGWQVITPLERSDGSIVLIDRGWAPDRRREPRDRPQNQATGAVTLVGYIKTAKPRGLFVPDNDAAKGNWYWVDTTAMAAHLKLFRVASYWVIADHDPGLQAGLAGSSRVAMPANNHLGYAITWYGLALSLVVLSVVYWRRTSSAEKAFL